MNSHPKFHKMLLFVLPLLLVLLSIIYIDKLSKVNAAAYRVPTEQYQCGIPVEIGPNFFFDASENPEGYEVTVLSFDLLSKSEYEKVHGVSLESLNIEVGDYLFDVEITFKNVSNYTNGHIYLRKYSLFSGALELPINYDVLSLVNPELAKVSGFSLDPAAEVTLNLPFTAMEATLLSNASLVNHFMQNRTFYLCISEFPIRKIVELL